MPKVILEDIIKVVNDNFFLNGLYQLSDNQKIFDIHVNSLINIALMECGYPELAKSNTQKILSSKLFLKKHNLFYTQINEHGKVISYQINSCKNALAILCLCITGNMKNAKKTFRSLFKSKLYNSEKKLFFREYNHLNNKIDKNIITHSNLWIALALININEISKAKKIINSLEKLYFNDNFKMFKTIDCEENNRIEKYFSDDQALAAIVYYLLGMKIKANKLINVLLKSKLYNIKSGLFIRNITRKNLDLKISSYKNGIIGISLALLGYKNEWEKLNKSLINILFDRHKLLFNASDLDKTKFPDNTILALLSLNYEKSKHIVL